MDLSIIIVNYNVKYFLEQCLCSVIKASKNTKAEIFVVDNGSTDGSREYLEKKFPTVIFKWNSDNAGFSKANNSVLKEATGTVLLFLNPDTIVPEDCFEKCLAFFRSTEHYGALGVRMIDGTGSFLRESKRSFPSPLASFFKITGVTKLFPHSKLFSKYYAGHLPEKETSEVDVLAGAFLMVHTKALDKTGGFDEDFFMYAEDIDLAYRIQNAGFKNYYFPGTTIIHFKGESTSRKTKLYIRRFYGAMQLFVKKHYDNKRTTRFLMVMAIAFSKTVSLAKLFLEQLFFLPGQATANSRATLVIADQVYFNDMVQLIKNAKDPLIIQGRISPDMIDKAVSTDEISSIQHVVLQSKASKIIFCEDPLSFKKMIEIMQQLRGKVDFLFHAKESSSIVGSNNKNGNGIFIAQSF